MYHVYTDGSCLKNPGGAGGWAFCFRAKKVDKIMEFFGGAIDTTNNRMELTAIIEVLKAFPPGQHLKIYSDSQYAIGVLSGKWNANKNQDLVLPFREEAKKYKIEWEWVRGHDGNELNEVADKLAGEAARALVAANKTID